jgi:TRAP transporter 4TM/12TM fusion protein
MRCRHRSSGKNSLVLKVCGEKQTLLRRSLLTLISRYKMRQFSVITVIAALFGLYALGMVGQLPNWFGIFVPGQIHGAISLFIALTLIFLLHGPKVQHGMRDKDNIGKVRRLAWYDYLLILSAAIGAGYIVLFHDAVLDYGMLGYLDTKGIILALLLVVPLLEGVRRTTGIVLPSIILFFVGVTVFQQYMPGILHGQGYGLDRLLYSTYVGESGIFGLPLRVAVSIVIVFTILGSLLQMSGAGRWFIDLSLALAGWSCGGPAKVAVLSSAMFGSISGSPSSNAASTGVFTIPMMKNIGYTPAFAAATEAVASTGGMILPPVMGAIAFVMAEWIGVGYGDVVIAALVPALLYYLILFVSVHLQAKKDGIRALPRSELPAFWAIFKKGWFYLVPIAALVYFLIVAGLPPEFAGVYTLPFIIGVSFLSPERSLWLTPRRIVQGFEKGVRLWVVVASVTGAVGIMVGALELSGVGIKVSAFIVDLSGGNLILTLVLVGFAALILGMGLDALPCYITLATIIAPALINLGVPPIAAHLFVIYWGLASFFTPPTCLAVFVTAAIADSKVWETGWEAVKLGIAAFLIPFFFVLNEGLLLRGSIEGIVLATGTAVVGSVLLACGLRGYALASLNAIQRVLLIAAGLLFIAPGLLYPAIGLALAAVAFLVGWFIPARAQSSVRPGT